MSLRGSTNVRTLCEVLREINDSHQGDNEHDRAMRVLLVEAEGMGKRMSKKLYEYNKNVFSGWWEKNPDYKRDLEKRLNEHYIVG
jgi:hypothetical protein